MEYSIVSPVSDTEFMRVGENYVIAKKRMDALQKILGTEFTIKFTFEGKFVVQTNTFRHQSLFIV